MKTNFVYDVNGKPLYQCEFIDGHPNQGLPDSFFEGEAKIVVSFDFETATAEWVPAMGPADCWSEKFDDIHENDLIDRVWAKFDKWVREYV